MKQLPNARQHTNPAATPLKTADRVRITDASFGWQTPLIGLDGNVLSTGANGLIYVDLKKHNHGITNGFLREHLTRLP